MIREVLKEFAFTAEGNYYSNVSAAENKGCKF